MEPALPSQGFYCTQCGGELHPDEGQIFLTCPYCSSTVYLDKSRVVFHWYLASTLDEASARGALARWMAGNQTVKDLDKKSHLVGMSFEYFPLWYFKQRSAGDRETILLEAAAATSVSELRHLKLPAGDLRKYDSALDAQARLPTVPLEAALAWVDERQNAVRQSGADPNAPRQQILEQALVHLPLWMFKYEYKGKPYTAVVEGGTGGVFANLYPAKAEAPYQIIGGVTAVVFLCLAAFPVVGAMVGQDGLGIGLLACSLTALIAAPVLLAVAAWIASKV